MDKDDELYMRRCLQLALAGAGKVAPNPMVGSVLVYNGRIIGEGFHRQYGGAHAEPNCIASVKEEDQQLIPLATLYVSLEPCAHFGKTPPCAGLIIRSQIKNVVVGCCDPFEAVNGKGIEILKAAGVNVKVGVLENECRVINHAFFTYHTKKRPYVVLKWAQSADGFIGGINLNGNDRVHISNPISNRLVHRWRSEIASIMVGTNTALSDNPSLTNRLWSGVNPTRLVVDRHLRLPANLQLLNDGARTIVFNNLQHEDWGNLLYCQLNDNEDLPGQVLHALHQLNINSVLIEGGAKLLQSFINAGLWDEARVITNSSLFLYGGVKAPLLSGYKMTGKQQFLQDQITFFAKSSDA